MDSSKLVEGMKVLATSESRAPAKSTRSCSKALHRPQQNPGLDFAPAREPTSDKLRSEELRRQRREKWTTQYGPDSQARKDAKDLKSEQHVDRGEGKNPKPGKDIEESRGRDDGYGVYRPRHCIDPA